MHSILILLCAMPARLFRDDLDDAFGQGHFMHAGASAFLARSPPEKIAIFSTSLRASSRFGWI
jgi:hypothetical protein